MKRSKFSRSDIAKAFPKLSGTQHTDIFNVLNGQKDPLSIDAVQTWLDGLYNQPGDDETKMQALNILTEGYGIEGITPDGKVYPIAEYVNQGDTYAATFIYDIENNCILLTSWGDFLEGWEQENQQEEETEDEDEE